MKELKEFTVERLEAIIESDHAQTGDVAALAKIALAAKQAEPIAWTDREEMEEMQKGTYANMFNGKNISIDDGQWLPLYTTPPLNHTEQDGWISCSERMPEDSQWCAVNTEYGYYVQCWGSEQGWLGDEISIPNCDVTHWVPLPAAPKPEM